MAKTYSVFYDLPDDNVVAVVDFSAEPDTLHRVEGEWVPLEDEDFEALNGLPVDTMSEEIIELFDDAEREELALNRDDIAEYIVPSAETE